jgi:AmiR/NasT family two-component response regulator
MPAALNLTPACRTPSDPSTAAKPPSSPPMARLALTERREPNHQAATRAQPRDALTMRDVIGQAQGILMERDRITARQAFDVLRRASQHLNIKLRDVAEALVDTGEDPDTGPPRP